MNSLLASIIVHDDNQFLKHCIGALGDIPCVVYVSRIPWKGEPGDWQKSVDISKSTGAEVVIGDWGSEHEQRQAVLNDMKERGVRSVIVLDSDEIISPELLDSLVRIHKSELADMVTVSMLTYWKDTGHVIDPPERLTPYLMVNPQNCKATGLRSYEGGKQLHINNVHGVLHHLSYVGDDERIHKKISSWGHSHEVVTNWWESKWLAWNKDSLLRNLHPTHPEAYQRAVRISVPKVLEGIDSLGSSYEEINVSEDWPKVSIIIPLYGGEEDIRNCLEYLSQYQNLLHEVIVIDDASPDDAAKVVSSFEFVQILENSSNLGFAKTCNRGLEESTGDLVLFLNSDALMPRVSFIQLVKSLIDHEEFSAVGPLSDNVGYFQSIQTPYLDVRDLDLVAEDFSKRDIEPVPVSMLVGFCLLARASDVKELGGFSTEFGKGLFEDTDLCYRLQRSGKKLAICPTAFVHHMGSKSLLRLNEDPSKLLESNMQKYRDKWSEDIKSGFAPYLAGDIVEPIVFNQENNPDLRRERILNKSKKANISLCMIVKDEERVLADCLKSIEGVFSQAVIIDTGSTDQTVEIAKSFGAEVYEMEWPMSFALARNESLKYAKGDWVMWIDADDTLPQWAAEKILDSVINADHETIGFTVPVQFVENGQPSGTRVDHVKLFRNVPGVQFEGRIHEQVLPSLREVGGEVKRIDAYVLHSGYDTSEVGQAKKKKRDKTLLKLDLEDRPNHPFVLFNLGMTSFYNSELDEAVEWLEKCLDVSHPSESHVRKVYSLLGCSFLSLSKPEEAIRIMEEGIQRVGGDPELRFHIARAQAYMGKFHDAKRNYELVVSEPIGQFSSFDTGILGAKRLANLGYVCEKLGIEQEAINYYESALKSDPSLAMPAESLFELALKREDFRRAKLALQCLEELLAIEHWADSCCRLSQKCGLYPIEDAFMKLTSNPSSNKWRLALGRHLLQKSMIAEGIRFLIPLYEQGMPEAAFYIGVAYQKVGDIDKSVFWLERVLKINPHHKDTLQILNMFEQGISKSS